MNMKEAAQMAANQNGVITQTALNFQVNFINYTLDTFRLDFQGYYYYFQISMNFETFLK